MSSLAYNALKIENIRLEFLNKGFSKEAIDFVLLQNDNYNFEVLKEKMNSLEQQIINVEKNFQKDINSIYVKIDSVNIKIDTIEKALQKDISSLDNKIDVLKNELNASNRTIQEILIMGITLAPIIYSIFNKYFFN
ncbi:Bdr family repetitive protein (plasmid) [Borreliella andersonii]|uniref:Bdr family repetitive protein n=1 Tax=Borrelia andersonii TaxID=42109 RepID=A0ACD5G670_BORAD